VVHRDQQESRRGLEERFAVRADGSAEFIEIYVRELLKREQAQAVAQLADREVPAAEFGSVVTAGGYQAAVLLDARGRLLQVAPAKPELLGTLIGPNYAHLRSALAGVPAVSNVVPSAAAGDSVVGFAVPYETQHGRRVFSGAFDIARSPLAAYLPNVSPLAASAVELVDSEGKAVASSGRRRVPGLPVIHPASSRPADRSMSLGGEPYRIAVRPIRGTAWHLVLAAPEVALFASVTAGHWMQWIGLAIVALVSLMVVALIGRLLRTRTALVADIEQRRRVERDLHSAQARFERAFAEAPIGMALVGLDGGWQQVNRALCTMLRRSAAELTSLTRVELTHPEDVEADLAQVDQLVSGESEHCELEKRYIAGDSSIVWASLSRTLVRDATGVPSYLIAQVQDISERRRFETKLAHLADHDVLTGLFNRRRFEHELERCVADAERYGEHATLLLLDLDNFKAVNDTLGHAKGDELLVRVAGGLRERLRATDILARLGGDEFAVILPKADTAAASLVAAELLGAIASDGVAVDGHRAVHVSASIGIAGIEAAVPRTPAALMANADAAMYGAKESGRGCFAVHGPGAHDVVPDGESPTWVGRIQAALAGDGFVLYQQPILDLHTNTVTRHELLLRMVGPDAEHIAPASFLGVAERFGLIQAIDGWVIREAIALVAEQARRGRRVQVEINLSGLSLNAPDVLATIERELERSQIDPACLTFEITETAAIVNIHNARVFAERIAKLGCEFALDDFGAGFGSFYYLKHLPFDVLKIDGEFVRNLAASDTDRVMVKSLARIAGELAKRTIAECVEDVETLALVRSYGADYAQGFGIGRPQPVADWLRQRV
jgi:diguanylate cyclase (GGDEF)-like protein/PAS domain S-box-containing protein